MNRDPTSVRQSKPPLQGTVQHVAAGGRWGGLRSWLSDLGALAITAIGLALYVAMRIPTAVFYMRLGTSPEEVGIGYTDILSRSTLGTLVCLVVGSVFVYSSLSYLSIALVGTRTVAIARTLWNHEGDITTMDDAAFEARVVALRVVAAKHPVFFTRLAGDVDEYCRRLRRRRELARLANPTDAEVSELASLQGLRTTVPQTLRAMLALGSPSRRHVQRLIAVSAVVVLAALTTLATFEAEAVRDGDSPWLHEVPLFSFDAQPVELVPLDDPQAGLAELTRRSELFLLGRNDSVVVLYDADSDDTLRVPTGDFYLVSR